MMEKEKPFTKRVRSNCENRNFFQLMFHLTDREENDRFYSIVPADADADADAYARHSSQKLEKKEEE